MISDYAASTGELSPGRGRKSLDLPCLRGAMVGRAEGPAYTQTTVYLPSTESGDNLEKMENINFDVKIFPC